jgi:hypothetical protein
VAACRPNLGDLEELHRKLRRWYYDTGGLYLSELARKRYGDVQELIEALLKHKRGRRDTPLDPGEYQDLMETASAMRTALTQDLDTRRRKSIRETWRRKRWHVKAEREAKIRIEHAKGNDVVPHAGLRSCLLGVCRRLSALTRSLTQNAQNRSEGDDGPSRQA